MNLTIPFREQLSQADQDNLDLILSKINVLWNTEHNPDGTHAAITATSLVTTGDVTVGGYMNQVRIKDSTSVSGLLDFLQFGSDGSETRTEYTPPDFSATSVTADWTERAWTFDNNAIPDSDNARDLGYEGTHNRRWKNGWFKGFVKADYLYGVNGVSERSRAVPMGEWTTFTPTLTASAGTWTIGTVNTARYMLVGKTMFVAVNISGTNVSNAGVNLRIAIPGGFTAAFTEVNTITVRDNGTLVVGSMSVAATGTVMNIFTAAFGTFAVAVGNTDVYGVFAFEVQ